MIGFGRAQEKSSTAARGQIGKKLCLVTVPILIVRQAVGQGRPGSAGGLAPGFAKRMGSARVPGRVLLAGGGAKG